MPKSALPSDNPFSALVPGDDELFSEKFSAKSYPFFAFDTIGDKVKGFLVAKRTVMDKMKNKDVRQYVIALPDGQTYGENKSQLVIVQGRMNVDVGGGKMVCIIGNVDNAPLGSLVGVLYAEDRKSKGGFSNNAKILNGFVDSRNLRPDLVDKFGDNALDMGSSEGPNGEKMPF